MKLYFAGIVNDMVSYEDIKKFFFKELPVHRALISYAYINREHSFVAENWKKLDDCFLDSGAWTAFTKGTEVNIDEYGEFIEREGWQYSCICALDAIGDGEKTKSNWLYMKRNYPKYETLPTFHIGESFSILEYYLSHKPSLILLGAAEKQKTTDGRKTLRQWLDRIFLEYPHDYHMFGVNSLPILRSYPFVSCDASSYLAGRQFGKIFLPSGSMIDAGRDGKDRNRPDVRAFLEERGLDIDKEDFHYNEFLKLNLVTLYNILEAQIDPEEARKTPRQMRLF